MKALLEASSRSSSPVSIDSHDCAFVDLERNRLILSTRPHELAALLLAILDKAPNHLSVRVASATFFDAAK